MATFNGSADNIENNCNKVEDFSDAKISAPDGGWAYDKNKYPNCEAVATFVGKSNKVPETIVPNGALGWPGESENTSRADHSHALPPGVVFEGVSNIFTEKQAFEKGASVPIAPTEENDATNKKYVDAELLEVKERCALATAGVQKHIRTVTLSEESTVSSISIGTNEDDENFSLSQASMSAFFKLATPIVGDGTRKLILYVKALFEEESGSREKVLVYRSISIPSGTTVDSAVAFLDWRLLGTVGNADLTFTFNDSATQVAKYSTIFNGAGKVKRITAIYLQSSGEVLDLAEGTEVVVWGC